MNLVIIRGLPGSGKSTLAKTLFSEYVHAEADMFMCDQDGRYQYDQARLSFAHNQCAIRARQALTDGNNVVVSNTFVKKRDYQSYINMGVEFNATTFVIVANGSFTNVHGVPSEKVHLMRGRFEF